MLNASKNLSLNVKKKGGPPLAAAPEVRHAGHGVSAALTLTIAPPSSGGPPRRFDFGPPTSPVAAGFTRADELTLYSATQGYGFTIPPSQVYDQGADVPPNQEHIRLPGDDLTRDNAHGGNFEFRVDGLTPGEHTLKIWTGDFYNGFREAQIWLQGQQVDVFSSPSGHVAIKYFRFTVGSDGAMLLHLYNATGDAAFLNALEIDGEYIPPVPVTATHLIDCGADATPPPANFVKVKKWDFYNDQLTLGWSSHRGIPKSKDTGGDPLWRDTVYGLMVELRVDVPPGNYDVTVCCCDGLDPHTFDLLVQGAVVERVALTPALRYQKTVRVAAANGYILVRGQGISGVMDEFAVLNAVQVLPVGG